MKMNKNGYSKHTNMISIISIITDYDILRSDDSDVLAEMVRKKIKDGWQPAGDVFTRGSGYSNVYQKLVKYLKDPKFEEI